MAVQRFSISLEDAHVEALERHIRRIGLDSKESSFSLAIQSVVTLYDREQAEIEKDAPRGRTPAAPTALPVAA